MGYRRLPRLPKKAELIVDLLNSGDRSNTGLEGTLLLAACLVLGFALLFSSSDAGAGIKTNPKD